MACAQVSLGDRLAQGKHAFAQNGAALQTPLGFWTITGMGRLDGWLRHQKRIPSLACSRCATAFSIISLGRGIVLVCCTSIRAFFKPVLFYTPDASYRTIPPGTATILQDSSLIPLWILHREHQFVGLLLAVRRWDPSGHFSLPR